MNGATSSNAKTRRLAAERGTSPIGVILIKRPDTLWREIARSARQISRLRTVDHCDRVVTEGLVGPRLIRQMKAHAVD